LIPKRWGGTLAVTLLAGAAGCGERRSDDTLRVGHFPNVTHAQALVAHARSRAGEAWIEGRVGRKVGWYVYNAGPSAMEALLAGSLDLAYVGPSPALNAHLQSGGDEVRVVAGSAVGGAALVVREGGPARAEDFRGKRLATPQLGNTQDVSARSWLEQHGLRVTQTGGDVLVAPAPNPEQIDLLRSGDVDGVWTVEPWVSRLLLEAKGRILVEEKDALTTVLVARRALLEGDRDVVARFVEAHAELTRWVVEHGAEAKDAVTAEIEAETRTKLSRRVLDEAWARLRFETGVSRAPFEEFLGRARRAGFLRGTGTLDRLVERP
jgi:NitT/TauT family transport system substrate-binding protein